MIGLIILGLASVGLFSILWYTLLTGPGYYGIDYYWKFLIPPTAGAVVFILIGWYMMKSGVKKGKEKEIQLLKQQ